MNDTNQAASWKRMSFKGNKVWAAADTEGKLLVEKNRVLIKYNLKQDYEYKVKLESLSPEDQAIPAQKKSSPNKSIGDKSTTGKSLTGKTKETPEPENCIRIYTDGACSGNPGPAGIGVLFIYGENQKKISKYIGKATSNIAELTAIKTALEELKRVDLPVVVYTDSNYSIGVLTKNWKPQANKALIFEIKELAARFSKLRFVKVKGHSGIKENEVADFLATSAIKKGPL